MPEPIRLADLQLAIMQVLWDHGECTVADVRQRLSPERKLAHTTVGTMLTKLEEKGHVKHRTVGTANVFSARTSRSQVNRSMVFDLANRLFQGDVSQLVCQLLDGGKVTREELDRIKQLVREKDRELRDE